MAQGSLKKKVPPVKTKQKSAKRASESNAKTRKGAHMLPERAGAAQSSRRHCTCAATARRRLAPADIADVAAAELACVSLL